MSAKENINLKKISNYLASSERQQVLWAINKLKSYFPNNKLSFDKFEGINLIKERISLFYQFTFRNFILIIKHKSDSIRTKAIEICKNLFQMFFTNSQVNLFNAFSIVLYTSALIFLTLKNK